MTLLPRFASWDAFNGHLEEQCRNRQGNVLRGHRESIGERFVRDREALKRPLPAPFDACDKQGTRVNSLSLVRYRTNDYSVPVAYGHQEVWIRGYVHEVVIGCGAGMELARCEYVERRENIIALGNSGTGKTHIALGLGLAACQKGLSVGFLTAAALVHELMEARDEKRLLRLQKQLAKYHLLIIDELGFVPLSKTGAELLFEVFSQRYERGSILVTSNLPFDEWTEIFGSERLTGALLDRLTHHVHILEMNGESYRLNQSQKRRKSPKIPA